MIPGLSTVGSWTTIGPLMIFVSFSMAKEGYDDYRRYQADKSENRSEVTVLDPQGVSPADRGANIELGEMDQSSDVWTKIQWQDLRVGDIIQLERDESIPADIVLLHATGPNGIAYIETMALDGETNLKSKQACPLLAKEFDGVAKLASRGVEIVSEDPNVDLYNFEGRVTMGDETMPLTMNEVVYRGSALRNTKYAIGLVINTGEECKIRMNAHKNVHAKAPAMQTILNRIIILLVFAVLLLAAGCTIGYEIWKDTYEPMAWYLTEVPFRDILFGFVVMFNTLIPLSLYVSLEIIKIGQFILLQDVEMYDVETNTPMVANTTTILENLGQVSYVFSDKTGTLTENKMRFRKLTVAGNAFLHDMDVKRDQEEQQTRLLAQRSRAKGKQVNRRSDMRQISEDASGSCLVESYTAPTRLSARSNSTWTSVGQPKNAQREMKTEYLLHYIHHRPNTAFSKKTRQFLLCIALCHTALPERKDDDRFEFQAASPDELALVQAAQDLGYLLIDRPTQSIVLQLQDLEGKTVRETYQILDVIEFSSKRKRMSIIIRMPDGRICIFCKGADSAILERLEKHDVALEEAQKVNRQRSKRKSREASIELRRRSTYRLNRGSARIGEAPYAQTENPQPSGRISYNRGSMQPADFNDVIAYVMNPQTDHVDDVGNGNQDMYQSQRQSIAQSPISVEGTVDMYHGTVDESIAADDEATFKRCFQHIDDFASEGLRTLLFGYRYINESDYRDWNAKYQKATTDLDNRQNRIEDAAELIEKDFTLAGATAIEDKLQAGVPETIDKLRRANIKVWMLTGDKRETAINVAHSARICTPYSELYILDDTEDDLKGKIESTLVEVSEGTIAHSVVVVDGQTLGTIESNEELKDMFFVLAAKIDSVICCRASPAQKATLVECIKDTMSSSITLAIGDGANDIAMIQAAHVGVGISGREGLQAARISDFSIAKFRFLQRLLLVHGRWNYLRTGKYILATFWKEIVFYIAQAQYQRFNGYTGTSLYESWSLTVYNTLFTSLPVIIPGIFEKDLRASTLLAKPELYTYGQRNEGFNFKKYLAWNFMAAVETVVVYWFVHLTYSNVLFTEDTSLFAYGQLVFTVCVVFVNVKMLVLEMHHKTLVSFIALVLSVFGWFLWNLMISASGLMDRTVGPYIVRDAFINNFGRELIWWVTGLLTLAAVIIFELCVTALRRVYFPTDVDLCQEMENKGGVEEVLQDHSTESAAELGEAGRSGEEAGDNRGKPSMDDKSRIEMMQPQTSRTGGGG